MKHSIVISSLLFICLSLVIYSIFFMNDSGNNNSKIIDQYIEREEFDFAINYIDSIYDQNPDDISVLIDRAEVYYKINETKVSKDSWERCLEIDPNNVICAEKLVELYCTIGEVNCDLSIDYLLKIDSENITALNFKAKLEKDLGNIDNAIKLYNKTLEIDSRNINAIEELAILYTNNKNVLAIDYYDKLISLNPTSLAYYNYGFYFQINNDFINAIEKYKSSVSLNSNSPNSYYSMGYCYFSIALSSINNNERRKFFEEALISFNKTISLNGSYLEAYYARALCYVELGDKKSAIEDFKFCLMIEPGYEPAMIGIADVEKNI